MHALIMFLPAVVLALVPGRPLAPWGTNHHATDVPKQHVEQIDPRGMPTQSGKAARWTARIAARRSAWG